MRTPERVGSSSSSSSMVGRNRSSFEGATGRVVGPEDVAALAIHLMTNTALTGATYDIDGGQQLVS
jgi:NAD(P)-dependent dehydrogenase (short-subunit alcohol dehydrogenase family)